MEKLKTEYKTIQFIQEHLPLWKKKGMPRAFLDEVIVAEAGSFELDIESALTCDLDLFKEAYSQPDFIEKLIALCKKYHLQYGRVRGAEKSQTVAVEKTYDRYFKNMPARIDGEKEDGIKCADSSYQVHEVLNKQRLYVYIRDNIRPGDKKLSLSPRTIELLLSLARDRLSLQRIQEITCLSEKSIRRYYSALQNYYIVSASSKRVRGVKEFDAWVNYDVVTFADGYTGGGESYESELFSEC